MSHPSFLCKILRIFPGGLRLEYHLVSGGGGAAWSGNDQNIAENGWLLPFFAGGDAGKWVKESGGHLPWSVLSKIFVLIF